MPFTASRPLLFYRARGAGDPLLCIPGFGASSAAYETLSDLYETRFRLVTYDHLGSGRSDRYAMPMSMAELAAGAIRVLDDLGIGAAHVVGSSLGGLVAQELAIRFPHRVRGLVLAGTATSGPLATHAFAGVARANANIVVDSVRRRRLSIGRAMFSDEFARRAPDEADLVLRSITTDSPSPWTLFGQLLAFTTHDRERDLGRIRAPTLVLHGERDLLVSAVNAHRLARGIPRSEVHVLAGVGHACLFEQRQQVFQMICDWLDRQEPIAAVDSPSALGALGERLTRKAAVPIGVWRVQRNSVALGYRALTNL